MIKYLKKKNTKYIILFISFLIVFLGSAYFQRKNMMGLYEAGIEEIENQNYEKAQEILSELGDYKDSLQQIEFASNSAIYENAVKLYKNGEYERAVDEFSRLGDFKESKNFISRAQDMILKYNKNEELYNEACDSYASENYRQAIEKFTKLGDYKDSGKLCSECRIKLVRLQQSDTLFAGIRCSVALSEENSINYSGDEPLLKKELMKWKDIISISARGNLIIGLKKDGTVLTANRLSDYYFDTSTWNDMVEVSAGERYIVGLKSNGKVIALGHNGDGQSNVKKWSNIVSISTGWRHTVGLDSHGKIHMTGYRSKSQLNEIKKHKSEWENIIAISAGGGSGHFGEIIEYGHTVALKKDGTVVAVGDDSHGQCDVYDKAKWSNIISISAGDFHTVGLKVDGTVVTTEKGDSAEEIGKWKDIVAVSAGYGFTLGLKSDGTVIATGYDHNDQINVKSWEKIVIRDEWETIFDDDLRWGQFDR